VRRSRARAPSAWAPRPSSSRPRASCGSCSGWRKPIP
jgi:hypothetical protein